LLTACSRLVSIDFSDNLLISLEGLSPCSGSLTKLCSTGKLFTQVDPLTALVKLRRLDLGDNQLTASVRCQG
jgi:Leucine-rich repeat (LRR) protein